MKSYDIFHISGYDELFLMIHERIPVHAGDIQPAMWRYRARITLEHLAHALQQNNDKTLVILKEFLRLVSMTIIIFIILLLRLAGSIKTIIVSDCLMYRSQC